VAAVAAAGVVLALRAIPEALATQVLRELPALQTVLLLRPELQIR
jgi:hypothetical protein